MPSLLCCDYRARDDNQQASIRNRHTPKANVTLLTLNSKPAKITSSIWNMEGKTDTTSTDGDLKPQKKQICRFFTSKGKCYTKPYMRTNDVHATIFNMLYWQRRQLHQRC